MRQNLSLVVGLQGRFSEAEQIARQELSQTQANANVTYLRSMLSQQNTWAKLSDNKAQRRTTRPIEVGEDLQTASNETGPLQTRAAISHLTLAEEETSSETICDLNTGGSKNDGNQDRQEEYDHRNRQLWRKCGSLLFCFVHALVAAFLRQNTQRLRTQAYRNGPPE